MRKLALLLSLALAGGACSSAAAPGAGSTIAQKDKATTIQVEAALRSAALAEETYFVDSLSYTDNPTILEQLGYNSSPEVDIRIARGDATSFCIDSSSAGAPMHIGTPDKTPRPGACS